ncbi:MAG TPA: hypothetical protein GX404_09455 [Syntrophomonadaceae bacterium]|nr:hypothetical protein [Syntrophomonadaceae bacterium]
MIVIDALRQEHEMIDTVIKRAVQIAQDIRNGHVNDLDTMDEIVNFLIKFTNQYHFGKEEEYLFPTLFEKGVPDENGPVGVMLKQHALAREYLASMTEALEKLKAGRGGYSAKILHRNTESYAKLLENHMQKENTVLFPMIKEVLSSEEQDQLEKDIQAFIQRKPQAEIYEQYANLAARL